MAFDDDQPIVQGIIRDESGNAVGIVLDGSIYRFETRSRLSDGTLDSTLTTDENSVVRLPVEGFSDSRIEDVVVADFYDGSVPFATGQDYILVDLDNTGVGAAGTGPYKHGDGTGLGIKIRGMGAKLVKSKVKDTWTMRFGVITRIDGTDADISWVEIGSIHASDTARTAERVDPVVFPLELDMTSTLTKIATGFNTLTDTTVTTVVTLADIAGNLITPGVGDILLRVTPESATGDALIHYSVWYVAE